jgi:hypothetical protein
MNQRPAGTLGSRTKVKSLVELVASRVPPKLFFTVDALGAAPLHRDVR